MTFRQIQAFLLVVRTGTIAAAADHMGLTQSGVSRLVSELSRNVGFELFDRVGRGVKPTARGMAFFKVAEGVYDNAQTLQRLAGEIREGVNDRVRLSCLPTVAISVLPAVLERFHRKYPNVFVDIHAQPPAELPNFLSSGKLDFAVTLGLFQMDGFHIEPFARCQYILAVHKEHVLAKKDLVEQRDLVGHDLIGFESDSMLRPNDDEAKLIGEAVTDTSKRIWCQSSMVRYALLSNKRYVNIAEPFSFPLFAQHNIVARTFSPNVTTEMQFVMPAGNVQVPIYSDLRDGFREATAAFAAQHNLPIKVVQSQASS